VITLIENNNNTVVKPRSRSRRQGYYDLNEQRIQTRVFSQIEIDQANNAFDTIEHVLDHYGLAIRRNGPDGGQNKWVSTGRCSCSKKHDPHVYFIVEIDDEIIDVGMIHALEEELEAQHLKPVHIIARHKGHESYLELVVMQRVTMGESLHGAMSAAE
jgi:hypothetical protein